MPSSYSTNLNLELQATGEHSGTWGSTLNSAALQIIDQAMGGVQTISLASSNVVVSTAQSQNNFIKLTGALGANVDVTFPAIGRTFFIKNSTTGNYTVTLKANGGGVSAIIPRGFAGFFIVDPTDITPLQTYFGAQDTLAGGTTTDLGTIPSRNVSITGSGYTITSFGSVAQTVAPIYILSFVSTGTITYNATSMILPGATSISVGAGDTAIALYLGSGNWKILQYTPYSRPLSSYTYLNTQRITATGTYTPTTGTRFIRVRMVGGGGGGGGADCANTDSGNGAGGGGSGEVAEFNLLMSGISSVAVTIGAGGTAGISSGGDGGSGGSTIFGAYSTVLGGSGGEGVSGDATRGADGGAGGNGGSITAPATGILLAGNGGGFGTAYVFGAGYNEGGNGGAGGGSPFGGGAPGTNARGSSQSQNGVNATGYGSGGSGAAAADNTAGWTGGTGSAGLVVIDEYA